jgi:hypothetical protein
MSEHTTTSSSTNYVKVWFLVEGYEHASLYIKSNTRIIDDIKLMIFNPRERYNPSVKPTIKLITY